MGSLRVIRAGAGTGKTHRVCEEIAARILGGTDPARVLATTFTRKAAAELKGRIESRILDDQNLPLPRRLELAERLELALIDTVHSVGWTLLSRYAIALGLSPRLQVLEVEPGARHVDRIIAGIRGDSWAELQEVGRRLGQGNPAGVLRSLLEKKRSNNITDSDFAEQLTSSSDDLCALLASGADVEPVHMDELYGAVEKVIGAIRSTGDTTKGAESACQELHQIVMRRRGEWGDFIRAAKIKSTKSSNECLDPLRHKARSVRRSHQLHADLRRYSELLTSHTIALEREYGSYKKERGLVDFTDMEVLTLDLLGNPDMLESLRAEIEFVVVDEFQDTNPIQLAIFQMLHEIAAESVWVGDEKQAIYGFRGTDLELIRGAWNRVDSNSIDSLGISYRSQGGLVAVANRLFTPEFGDDCALQADKSAAPGAVERWNLQSTNVAHDHSATAVGVAALCAEGMAPRDIAVLVRTNSAAHGMAEALHDAGIQAVVAQPGLLGSRECALALAGLRVVADKRDSLAEVTIEHILSDPDVDTPEWFPARLRRSKEQRDARKRGSAKPQQLAFDMTQHGAITSLHDIDPAGLDPAMLVAEVIDALALPSLLASWGNPSRRGRNLDSLISMARDYVANAVESGEPATLTGLISWLDTAAADGTDLYAMGGEENAVQVHTYHTAKGLEWPIVVLTQLDYNHTPDLWSPTVTGGNAGEGKPLESRRIRNWVWPFGTSNGGYGRPKPLKGSGLAGDVAQSEAGLAAHAREIAEARRLLYVGFTRASRKVILAHRPGKTRWLQLAGHVDELLPPGNAPGEHEIPGTGTTMIVRELIPAEEEVSIPPGAPEQCWLAVPETTRPFFAYPQRYHSPSGQPHIDSAPDAEIVELPGHHHFPPVLQIDRPDDFGNAIHAYFAALPSITSLSRNACEEVAVRCLRGFGVENVITPDAIVQAGERLMTWIDDNHPDSQWFTEVRVTGERAEGGRWEGIIDLLIIDDDKSATIIDHKTQTWGGPTKRFAGQLAAYEEALRSGGLTVKAKWIHLPLVGAMHGLK